MLSTLSILGLVGLSEGGSEWPTERLHLTTVTGINTNHGGTPHVTLYHRHTKHRSPLRRGNDVCMCVCACVCVGTSVYARVFVCLSGMAGQRNALAYAWLSRHNGPALSHCREIPVWYRGRERKRRRCQNQMFATVRKTTFSWDTIQRSPPYSFCKLITSCILKLTWKDFFLNFHCFGCIYNGWCVFVRCDCMWVAWGGNKWRDQRWRREREGNWSVWSTQSAL